MSTWSKQDVEAARQRDAEYAAEADKHGRYGRPIKAGTYPCEVVDAGEKTSQSGNVYDQIVLRVDAPRAVAPDGPVKLDFGITAVFKATNVAEAWPALVRTNERGDLVIDPHALVGARAKVVVGLGKEFRGERRMEAQRLLRDTDPDGDGKRKDDLPPARPDGLRDDQLPF